AGSVACLQGNHLCKMRLTCRLIQTTLRRACPTTPFPGSKRAGTEIREGTRKLQVDTKGILMHIDRANEITMATKAALAARPSSAFGLVTMPAAGTPAAGASFGAGRARDAGLLRFVGEVINVAAVFPLPHAAVVMSATVPVAHAIWVPP